MRPFASLRTPHRLRALLATLVLAFALSSVAHAAHTHDPAVAGSAMHAACGYCFAFGAAADAPVHAGIAAAPRVSRVLLVVAQAAVREQSIVLAAAPRGPPVS